MTDDAAPVLEQEPAAAVTLFGDRIELARSFTVSSRAVARSSV